MSSSSCSTELSPAVTPTVETSDQSTEIQIFLTSLNDEGQCILSLECTFLPFLTSALVQKLVTGDDLEPGYEWDNTRQTGMLWQPQNEDARSKRRSLAFTPQAKNEQYYLGVDFPLEEWWDTSAPRLIPLALPVLRRGLVGQDSREPVPPPLFSSPPPIQAASSSIPLCYSHSQFAGWMYQHATALLPYSKPA